MPAPSLDELLGSSFSDIEHGFVEDFSTLSCQCVLVVEFCEKIGPRVIHRVPTWCGPHLNVDTLALWLSCTAHLQSTTVNQVGHTADTDVETKTAGLPFIDVQVIAHHTVQGIHTYAHHFTLYDVSARGFVRTFCLAFCAPHEASFTKSIPSIRCAFTRSVRKLRACNTRRFNAQLTHSLHRLEHLLQLKTNTYYELYYDNNVSGSEEKHDRSMDSESEDERSARALSSMRRVQRTLLTAHTALTQQLVLDHYDDITICKCDLSHLDVIAIDKMAEKELPDFLLTMLAREAGKQTFRHSLTSMTSPPRDPSIDNSLYTVVPCQYESFCAHIRRVWSRCNRQRRHSRDNAQMPIDPMDCVARMNNRPLIYMPTPDMMDVSGTTSTMTSSAMSTPKRSGVVSEEHMVGSAMSSSICSTYTNTSTKSHSSTSTTDLRDISYDSDDLNNNSASLLVHMCNALPRLVAPLWTGQLTIVCSSRDSRTAAAKRLVRLLHTLLLTGAQTAAHSLCLRWHRGRLPPEAYCTYKLCGVHATTTHCVAENIRPFVCIMDLDSDQINVRPIHPKILLRTCQKLKSATTLTDACVQSALYSCAAHYAWLAHAFYHYARAPIVRTIRKPSFQSLLRLEEGDMKIIRYMCELTRVGVRQSSHTMMTSMMEGGASSDDEVDVIDELPVTPAWQFDTMFVDYGMAGAQHSVQL